MAQPSQIVPTVTMNVSGHKQQVNLRDYLNVRVAPYIKKAIHDSLETEAQYPLQWLGEHLIQQSIIYEGNPDATNLRERFAYNHDKAKPKQAAPAEAKPQDMGVQGNLHAVQNHNTVNGTGVAPSPPTHEAAPHDVPTDMQNPQGSTAAPSRDTEMGGTS